ncbi:autotransporter assembly complex family protein [Pseudomaricurvus sp. HS19]|uniref:autotransporter assembly complex protein TamA n=1 Tax=Pseudomaricurvus sp. HS19 TaxID=2692626 RepID=UPI00136AF199|nr:BamA/TamA family outer membrane protein [Pseudomaricurvus sp. HS19]MYM64162.1 BamA/TamA family outer membrane protein [Pseudomaricurvus sp. HS19]
MSLLQPSRLLLLLLLCLGTQAVALPLLDNRGTTVSVTPRNDALATQLQKRLRNLDDSDTAIPLSDLQRQQRARQTIDKLLRSEGYYNSRIHSSGSAGYSIDTGPRYQVRTIRLDGGDSISDWPSLQPQAGEPLRARQVLESRATLLRFLRQQCHANGQVDYQVVLDSDNHQADITFKVTPGPAIRIGEVTFSGQVHIEEPFLRNSLQIASGRCLRVSELDEARLTLLQSGLLTSVHYDVTPPQQDGDLVLSDVHFRLTERRRHSVRATVGYTTDAREGATVGWENRNLWGSGEHLKLEAGADQINQLAKASLTLPQFLQPQQDLELHTSLEEEDTDSYLSRSREAGAMLTQHWTDHLHTNIGLVFTNSRVEEDDNSERFELLSMPLGLVLNYSDNLLDPTRGWNGGISLRPYTDLNQEDLTFLQNVISLRGYYSLDDWGWRPTLALRATTGLLTGAALESIPADQRFYVGGGGSVRGYPYQSVGELEDGDPRGGLSFSEASLELRLRVGGNWGVTLFADGGYAYPDRNLSFGENWLWGAGIGLRYHTRFAPLRFDLATPLNKRDGIDDDLQFYISFGQAF